MLSSPFDVQIIHSVEDFDPAAWDYLAQNRPFASYRWHRFGELVLTDDLPIYILLSLGGKTVARATFWLKHQEPLPISSPLIRRSIDKLLQRWPLLVCRAPLADAPGLILPEPPLRDLALQTITQVAHELAQEYRASFLLFDYLNDSQSKWKGWPEHFVTATIADPGTCLPIVWPDFEGYLSQLPKSMRSNYRRNGRKAAELGIEVKRYPRVEALDEALRLIRNVETRHNASPKPWARAMLAGADLVNGTWLTAEIKGDIVACCLFLGDGDTRFLTLLGRDYEVDYAYFQLVYAGIRRAIEEGVRVLRAGSGAYEVKRRLGFNLENDNHVKFTARSRVLRWLGSRLTAG